MGWHCQPIATTNTQVTYFSTPFVLPDGKPFDFYIEEHDKYFVFTDDRMTIFSLSSAGHLFDSRNSWKGISNIATKYGFNLSDDGEILASIAKERLPILGKNILMLFSEILRWQEQKASELIDLDASFLEEIEFALTSTSPHQIIERNASLKVEHTSLEFSFKWGSLYIDGVKPIAQSVNSRLRKALIANKVLDSKELLFIIDDRENSEKALEELEVIGKVAPATLLQQFKRSRTSNQLTH